MNAPEQPVGGKIDIVADAVGVVPAALTAFQAHPGVVVDVPFPVDDGALDTVIAHDIDAGVHPVAVSIGGDDAEVVPAIGGGGAIIDFIQRAGVGPEGRIKLNGSQAVGAADVELDHGSGGLSGNAS